MICDWAIPGLPDGAPDFPTRKTEDMRSRNRSYGYSGYFCYPEAEPAAVVGDVFETHDVRYFPWDFRRQ